MDGHNIQGQGVSPERRQGRIIRFMLCCIKYLLKLTRTSSYSTRPTVHTWQYMAQHSSRSPPSPLGQTRPRRTPSRRGTRTILTRSTCITPRTTGNPGTGREQALAPPSPRTRHTARAWPRPTSMRPPARTPASMRQRVQRG